ncbi:LYR motif-containing protein 1 isoform X1 [Chiroxiphia lanceolata]|uniref:LYR motif-containing protein 1 isoform X1 n=2 Tax=Chiroxiphia lanceolata TaxID=296741 RepID=UPI0013CEB38D|nr:LYR motif-containing protein 1 isoform X1 [Chiroxiphia lanceolata]
MNSCLMSFTSSSICGKESKNAKAQPMPRRGATQFCSNSNTKKLKNERMTPATRQKVLGLYRKIFQIAKKWQSASGQTEETVKEKEYIKNEARTLFQKNKHVTDPKLIEQCIEECEARIEIGLHYNIPYPRPIHLPPMGLAHKQGRTLRHQEKLRKISKPIYLKSHDEVS